MPTVAPTSPSVVALPSGIIATTATTTTIAATTTLVHSTTLRRSNRSMNTPMNGEISVYGT